MMNGDHMTRGLLELYWGFETVSGVKCRDTLHSELHYRGNSA